MQRKATVLDDISHVIGFTATSTLAVWFGGRNVNIPKRACEEHIIAKHIGMQAFKLLVAEFGGETFWVPEDYAGEREQRDKLVAEMIVSGKGSKAMAAVTGLTEARIRQLRTRLEQQGVVPMVLTGESVQKNPGVADEQA